MLTSLDVTDDAERRSHPSSPALRATFDAANFAQCGVRPFPDAYPLLRPYLAAAGPSAPRCTVLVWRWLS